MAGNMMEVLKQIQCELADQRNYRKNLDHVASIHVTIMETISELHKKIDQQQLTIEKLELQVRRNNYLLFGNDDSPVEDNTSVPHKQNIQDEKKNGRQADENKVESTVHSAVVTFVKDTRYDEDRTEESSENEREVNVLKDVMKASMPIDIPSRFRQLETVQICPAYFSGEQISKLNNEFKRITEKYQATNIFPNIEIVPDTKPIDDHPVMKRLNEGILYRGYISGAQAYYGIKIGTSGFERPQVRDLLAEEPDLSLYDVVREGLKSTNEWRELYKMFNFVRPDGSIYPN